MEIKLIVIILMLFMSGLFSCSETSLFSLSRSELAKLKSSKSKYKRQVIEALSQPRQLLVSILIGNELVNVAISILVASFLYNHLDSYEWQSKLLLSVAVSTTLVVIFGEVIPKNVGIRFASLLAPALASIIRLFSKIVAPVRILLLKLTDKAILVFGGDPNQIRSMIIEEEFRQMVDLGYEEGSLGEAEGELIQRVFDIGDKTIDKIMTPKEEMFSLSINASGDSALEQIRATQFSRIPVYDSDPVDIVGILHVRDFFSEIRKLKVGTIREMEDIIRPALFTPRTATIEETLREFQKLKIHMAIVVDKKRKPVGVVTMDDIFDAIFRGE